MPPGLSGSAVHVISAFVARFPVPYQAVQMGGSWADISEPVRWPEDPLVAAGGRKQFTAHSLAERPRLTKRLVPSAMAAELTEQPGASRTPTPV